MSTLAQFERREPTEAEQNGIMYQIRQKYGIIADTDGYKLSHMPQYLEGADMMVSYFEARGGDYERVLNYGAQLLAKEYFLQRLTKKQVKNMMRWAKKYMNGNMVDDLGIALMAVVDELGGRMPIRIRNAKEGLMIPIKNVVLTIETTVADRRFFSLVSFFETKIVRLWKTMTVGTTSFYVRKAIMKALQRSSDDPEGEIDHKFVDFGSRATGGMEDAAFAGSAHLVSSMASDTIVASMAVEFAYGTEMASYSIPASEHSTSTMGGPEGEIAYVKRMFDAYAKPGAAFATVIDGFDALNFVRNIAPLFKERLIESGAHWVFRPDSGNAITMPIKIMQELEKVFGSTVNKKGYKVLNNVSVIQGDGIVPADVTTILNGIMDLGYSATSIAFGMGGGLLQKVNRDTHKFALKCSAVRVNGVWIDVYKDPAVYDENWHVVDVKSFKASKRGRQELLYNAANDEYLTIRLEEMQPYLADGWEQALETVVEDAYMVRDVDFNEVRRNSGMFAKAA